MKALFLLSIGSLVAPSEDPARPADGIRGAALSHAWADFDGDGLADLLTVGASGEPKLLRNAGDGTFEDASLALGLASGIVAAGVQWVDYDGDRREDLFLWTAAGRPHLLRNEAGANLVDVTQQAGIEAGGVLAAEWVDWDADGKPDLVLTTEGGPALFHSAGSTFHRVGATLTGLAGRTGPGIVLDPVTVSPSPGTEPPAPDSLPGRPKTVSNKPEGDAGTSGAPGGSSAGGRSPGGRVAAAPSTPLFPDINTVGLSFKGGMICAGSINDMAAAGCITASSSPLLGKLYPLSTDFFVAPNGDVGLGTTNPAGELSIGNYQGGVGAGQVGGFKKQLVLSGPYNQGTNTGNSVKLLIADYDNDTSDIYPIYVEDEGNQVDFYVRKQGQVASTYMRNAAAVGTTPNQGSTFHVRNSGQSPQYALRVENFDTTSGFAALNAWHAGPGPGVVGIGETGVHGLTGQTAGYGVHAESSAGIALLVECTNASSALPAAQISTNGTGPALQVLTSDPTSPLAAQFEGDLWVGTSNILGVTPKVLLEVNGNSAGEIRARDSAGLETVVIQSEEFAASGGAQIQLKDKNGVATITMDADHSGSGRVLTEVLEITGGADLVESFTARGSEGGEIEPGTVLVADPDRPGELCVSGAAYDRAVVGVVSGAGGVRPGLHLAQKDVLDGDTPVALSGRVYVKACAENGPIRAGDLLTTASLAGHAMRADDPDRAFGAVLGKALSGIDEETGLVLLLVSLQ